MVRYCEEFGVKRLSGKCKATPLIPKKTAAVKVGKRALQKAFKAITSRLGVYMEVRKYRNGRHEQQI